MAKHQSRLIGHIKYHMPAKSYYAEDLRRFVMSNFHPLMSALFADLKED